MPERSALKMPWPDTGSKQEAASPTREQRQRRLVAVDMRASRPDARAAGRAAARPRRPSARDASPAAPPSSGPTWSMPSVRSRSPSLMRGDDAPAIRACAAVYHQPSGTVSIISPSPSSAASANATSSRPAGRAGSGAGRSRARAPRCARSRRSRSARSCTDPSPQARAPRAVRERQAGHAAADHARWTRVRRRRAASWRRSARGRAASRPDAVWNRNSLLSEPGAAPGAQRAIGRRDVRPPRRPPTARGARASA